MSRRSRTLLFALGCILVAASIAVGAVHLVRFERDRPRSETVTVEDCARERAEAAAELLGGNR